MLTNEKEKGKYTARKDPYYPPVKSTWKLYWDYVVGAKSFVKITEEFLQK